MAKRITLSLILLIASVSFFMMSVILVFHQQDKKISINKNLHQNPISIYELQRRSNKKVNAIFEGKMIDSIYGSQTTGQNITLDTFSKTSLHNFFYKNSGTQNPLSVYSTSDQVVGFNLQEKNINLFLTKQVPRINRPHQDAILIIKDGRAVEFTPDLVGRSLDKAKSAKLIKSAFLSEGKIETPLVINESEPKTKLSETNGQGINELIGRGVSDFSGSSRARIQNIKVGADRYNGLIIKPGAQFSFNDHLGPVTAEAGFLPELVIKAEGTVPEFGGGLCQVSSTAFRAAFFSGTKIDERRNHSYAVKYYKWFGDDYPVAEGMDATIYPGVVDMKFTNDTPAPILISTYFEGNLLYFDFYGTSDNRKVLLEGPETYDKRASGALKSKVVRKVIKNGVESEDVFYSNYVSPDKFPRTYEYAEGVTQKPPESTTDQANESVIN